MSEYKPPFEMNDQIINRIVEIGELCGEVTVSEELNLKLRRENRIKTIHSSLAIEQNTLTLEQVTDVIDGKKVLAPPQEIKEVKNAYEIYEKLDLLNPNSLDDLLLAHGVMMQELINEAGRFRKGNAGVYAGEQLIHAGTPAKYIPEIMNDLFVWLKDSELHPLVKSCIFHYEFEFIHPFADGNGRIGRLWHTLILSKWQPFFAWVPIESLIHDHQQDYYDAFEKSNQSGLANDFVLFMLGIIMEALEEIKNAHKLQEQPEDAKERILQLLKEQPKLSASKISQMLNLSDRQVERHIKALREEGKLVRQGSRRDGYWKVIE